MRSRDNIDNIFNMDKVKKFFRNIEIVDVKENIIRCKQKESKGFLRFYNLFKGIDVGIVEYHGEFIEFDHEPLENILQINYCLKGSLGWQLDNGDCLYLGEDDISIHTLKQCAKSEITMPLKHYLGISIFIDITICQNIDYLQEVDFDAKSLMQKFCHTDQTTLIPAINDIGKMFSLMERLEENFYPIYLRLEVQKLLLYLFFIDISKVKEQKPYSRKIIEIIKKVHEKIITNLDKRFTIKDLSKEFLINSSTLKKVFKAIYGKPIAQYIKFYRMQVAANLLCKSDLSVGEIAIKLGYENQSKFAGAFREIMQISPLKYRKNYKM